MISHSIAWAYEPGTDPADERTGFDPVVTGPRATTVAGVAALETAVADIPSSVVLRLGTVYGPGTWYARDGAIAVRAWREPLVAVGAISCFVHVDDAVQATVQALAWPGGPVNIVDDRPAPDTQWMRVFRRRVGATEPRIGPATPGTCRRPVRNAYAHRLGWRPAYPDWSATLGRQPFPQRPDGPRTIDPSGPGPDGGPLAEDR